MALAWQKLLRILNRIPDIDSALINSLPTCTSHEFEGAYRPVCQIYFSKDVMILYCGKYHARTRFEIIIIVV